MTPSRARRFRFVGDHKHHYNRRTHPSLRPPTVVTHLNFTALQPHVRLIVVRLMRSPLLTLLFAASCFAADDQPGWYAAYGDVGDQHFQSKATWPRIEQAPRWSPDTQQIPPLSPGRAQAIARKQLDRLIPAEQTWHLHAVRIVDAGLGTHWLYEISFQREFPADVAVFGGQFMEILVLMDGAAIEPIPIVRPGPDHPNGT
jgi:hypothetical protein